MAVAEGLPAAGLVLLSYPLHPPGKHENLRTEHFPELHVPCLFVSGDRDPFGSPDEFAVATKAIPGSGDPGVGTRRSRSEEGRRGGRGGCRLDRHALDPPVRYPKRWSGPGPD